MNITVRLLGVQNFYVLKYDNNSVYKGVKGMVQDVGKEEAAEYGLSTQIDGEKLVKIQFFTDYILYNRETVTITKIRVQLDNTDHYSIHEDLEVSNVANEAINKLLGLKGEGKIDIDLRTFNNNLGSDTYAGIELIVNTEDKILIGSLMAPTMGMHVHECVTMPETFNLDVTDEDIFMQMIDSSCQEMQDMTEYEDKTLLEEEMAREILKTLSIDTEDSIEKNIE